MLTGFVKKIFTGLILSMICLNAFTQTTDVVFDSLRFEHHLELAEWLYDYDEISLALTDSLRMHGLESLTEAGKMNYCKKMDNGSWNVFIGRSEKFGTTTNLAFEVDAQYRIHSIQFTTDSSINRRFLNALIRCKEDILSISDSVGVTMNQYIRELNDQSIEVWVLPAFQSSGQAIYGIEWMFHYSSEGTELLDFYSYNSGVKGVWIGQPRELWLNYRDRNFPTAGSIYFAWSYKDYFTKLHIVNQQFTITLQRNQSGAYYWNYSRKKE